jgi:hypothetical protein
VQEAGSSRLARSVKRRRVLSPEIVPPPSVPHAVAAPSISQLGPSQPEDEGVILAFNNIQEFVERMRKMLVDQMGDYEIKILFEGVQTQLELVQRVSPPLNSDPPEVAG